MTTVELLAVAALIAVLAPAAARGATAPATGHAAQQLTAANATQHFRANLARVYRRAWTRAGRRWAKCPRQQFFPRGLTGQRGPEAICMAQFRHRRRWRRVQALLEQTESGPGFRQRPFTRTWRRRWQRRGATCRRQAGVRGTISSNDATCPALMVSDLAFEVRRGRRPRRAISHGTNTAGFERIVIFRCRTRGRTIRCTNGMGDAFRWRR